MHSDNMTCTTAKRARDIDDVDEGGPSSPRLSATTTSDEFVHAVDEAGPSESSNQASKKRKRKQKIAVSPGIIYISRLPPGMTPQKVRHLMARMGEVGRVFAQRRDGASFGFCSSRYMLEYEISSSHADDQLREATTPTHTRRIPSMPPPISPRPGSSLQIRTLPRRWRRCSTPR
jgi:hypothetical protein